MDVGDVLVRIKSTAHYHALGRLTGRAWEAVAAALEGSGTVVGFGTGRLDGAEFTDAVRELLGAPTLAPPSVREAWNAAVGEPDPLLSAVAAPLAAVGRLLLASNINPFHWLVARDRLARVGVTAPACLSFEVGHLKPASEFYEALAAADPRVGESAVFIDDQLANVEAARKHGMTGWLHRDLSATAGYLTGLAR
jgi:putative hydrolase of the HAD superfamily